MKRRAAMAKMVIDHPSASGPLVLAAVLDLQQAKPLAAALLGRRGATLEIDASDVRRLGGLCLQVLLSAVDTWAADGLALTFRCPSPAFIEGFELLGAARAA